MSFYCFCTKKSATHWALFVFKHFEHPFWSKKLIAALIGTPVLAVAISGMIGLDTVRSSKFTQKYHLMEDHMPLPVKNCSRSKLHPGLPTSMQFYTIAEVAIILETKVGSVHKWIQDGLLLAVQFSNEKHML